MPHEAATPSPAAAAGDVSQGYCIKLSVLPSGAYAVEGPLPYEAGEAGAEEYPSIGAALKRVLDLVKDNPTTGDDGAQMEAGYAAR